MIKNMVHIIKCYVANMNDTDYNELKNIITGYVAKLNDKNYNKLKEEVLKVLAIEDKKRGIK